MNGLAGAFTIIQTVIRFFTDTGHFVEDAVGWMTSALFPPALQTWFLGTIGAPGQSWDSTQPYEVVYQAAQGPALVLAGASAAARLVRDSLDHRLPPTHAVFDILPRFLVILVIIGVPGTQVSAGYYVLVAAVDSSIALAHVLFSSLAGASLMLGVKPGEGWFTHLYQVIANAGRSLVAVVIGGIPLLILLIYAAFLMVVRTVMIGFCIATAPLCIATLALDARNRFIHFWLDMFIGALLTPVVFAVAISLSITLAAGVVSAAVVGPILAFCLVCGGLWMSAKAVHGLTWRHFSHGGALAGFAAGVSTVLAPLHKLAAAGFMAEALGGNRDGTNPVIGFMKRVGLASQGFSPHVGTSPAMLAAAGAGAGGSTTRVPDVHASHGPADIAAALSRQSRPAVEGVEPAFSQSAFNAFAHQHARLIGSLTRDYPFGSLSHGDRAKLAWSRSPAQAQTAFADDFLSLWLGGRDATLQTEANNVEAEVA